MTYTARRQSRYRRDERGRFEGGLLQGMGWGCGCFVAFIVLSFLGAVIATVVG